MSGYTKFDAEIYSEEMQPVTEPEHDEVMRLMADEGYHEWSEQLACSHFKCERGLRIGGFEL
jgi:hypothetical protein